MKQPIGNKVTIIGAGMVGSTIAYSLVVQDTVDEIALIDLDEDLTRAQVMDLEHAVPFAGMTTVKVGDYDDCADSAVTVIACGAAQKPGQTRLDLTARNAAIIKDILPRIFRANPEAVILMVTNPVDVLTTLAIRLFPEKKDAILGTGTVLDSARLRHLIGERLSIDPQSVHAYIVGEHGDSEFPLWSSAAVGNMNLRNCPSLSEEDKREIFTAAKNAAYAIIAGKQATYYAIGSGAAAVLKAILRDKRTVLPVSHLLEGEYGISGVSLSMPAVVGRGGVCGRLRPDLTPEERKALSASAQVIRRATDEIGM
ncbi:MAG TPA: L-lactate dehydrogenase [Candidatus Moranbacteria bacterium]|nr:L-lactate dehydrogenase [Candidatus Moranbacteria bacterium]